MLSKEQKKKLVLEVGAALKNSSSIIFTDFAGLTMAEITSIRKELKKQHVLSPGGSVGYKVIKKSLLDLILMASDKTGLDLTGHKGSLAVAYSSENGAAMAKTINSFASSTKKLNILGGFLMGGWIDAQKVVFLAKLPSREILLTQIVQLLMSPISGLARVLDGISKKEKVVKSNNTNTRMETNDTNEEKLLASFAID